MKDWLLDLNVTFKKGEAHERNYYREKFEQIIISK